MAYKVRHPELSVLKSYLSAKGPGLNPTSRVKSPPLAWCGSFEMSASSVCELCALFYPNSVVSDRSKDNMASVTPQVSYVSTDTTGFLEMVISKLGWSDLSDDIVMDVGCGNPKIKLANHLVNLFPNVKQVICIDKNSMMIHYLKISKRPSNIVYQNADIENRTTLIKWEGQIGKVVSTHCFHMLQDQKAAFQNVHDLLKPDGEAAILFCVQSGYVGWHCELRDDTKWNKYYNGNAPEIPSTQFMSIDDSYYKTML
ncbi:hypothetical protein AVEN_149691-1, partial [Araneus ventricosus]